MRQGKPPVNEDIHHAMTYRIGTTGIPQRKSFFILTRSAMDANIRRSPKRWKVCGIWLSTDQLTSAKFRKRRDKHTECSRQLAGREEILRQFNYFMTLVIPTADYRRMYFGGYFQTQLTPAFFGEQNFLGNLVIRMKTSNWNFGRLSIVVVVLGKPWGNLYLLGMPHSYNRRRII